MNSLQSDSLLSSAVSPKQAARPPQRRRRFHNLSMGTLRLIARQAIGAEAKNAEIIIPAQGINNQTYIVQPSVGPGIVIKFRPRPDARVRNSPQWSLYTQNLFGSIPNGGIATLTPIRANLARYGGLRTPEIHLVDESLTLAPAPYFIAERMAGHPFNWTDDPFQEVAAQQLGAHLGQLHHATATADGFGIYAHPHNFPLMEWWPRFAASYTTLLEELARTSDKIQHLQQPLVAALQRAVSSGTPESSALICIDQNPTHYLKLANQQINSMVDLEAHLWAPREYELAMVELWVRDVSAFQRAYSAYSGWPKTMEQVRPAYQLLTWMEWIYCLHTLLHDHQQAVELEERLAGLCAYLIPE